jgi:hypothetical protein
MQFPAFDSRVSPSTLVVCCSASLNNLTMRVVAHAVRP